jgi:xylulokinase
MSTLLLGIDVGTYSSKGVLVEPNGNILRTYSIEHNISIPHPGWAEQDADKIWWNDVVQICRNLLNGHPYTGEDVAGISLSAIGPCMLPLDKNGKPLRPGILYGVDTRATSEIDYLNEKIGEKNIYDFSGMVLSSQAVGPKILWMKRNELRLWKKVDHITTASSYLMFKMTGGKVIDRHTASHFIPLIDINKLEWSDQYSDEIIHLEKLPRLLWSDEIADSVSRLAARETGLKEGTPVGAGAVDALSESISVGCVEPGDLMIMYGSTAFFILVLDKLVSDKRLWSVAGAFKGQYNLAAGMATFGSITRWFRNITGNDSSENSGYSKLFSEADKIKPGAEGLIVLPYFSGERTPINDPKARGLIAGLSLSHTRNHIFRAILEGTAYGIKHNIETFKSIGSEVNRVIAVGGGTKSRIWPQIVSDVTGISQVIPSVTIGASYGNAFLAGLCSGILKRGDINSWIKYETTISPHEKFKKLYDPYYSDYLKLYQNTSEIIHRLSENSLIKSTQV